MTTVINTSPSFHLRVSKSRQEKTTYLQKQKCPISSFKVFDKLIPTLSSKVRDKRSVHPASRPPCLRFFGNNTTLSGLHFFKNSIPISYTKYHWNHLLCNYYIITQVILPFWLVLAYNLLEESRTIDLIITKFFPRRFKMAKSFENLDNILHDWEKRRYKKVLSRHWTGTRSRKKKDISRFFFTKWLRINTQSNLGQL